MLDGLKLLLGMVMFSLLCMIFACSMFSMIAFKEAHAVMGAPDQIPAEKKLSECQNDHDCKIAYDAVWGQGAWEEMKRIFKNCNPDLLGANCPKDHPEDAIFYGE